MDRYREALAEVQADFRSQLSEYVRLYNFLVQIITFVDLELEKLSIFSKYLLKKLPTPDGRYPTEIQQYVDLDSYRLQETSHQKIVLSRRAGEIEPMREKRIYIPVPGDTEALSQIIEELNQHFGANLTEQDKACIMELEDRLAENSSIKASIQVNSIENARLTFDEVARDLLQGMMEGHFKFYKNVNDNEAFAKHFFDVLFERYIKKRQGKQEGREP